MEPKVKNSLAHLNAIVEFGGEWETSVRVRREALVDALDRLETLEKRDKKRKKRKAKEKARLEALRPTVLVPSMPDGVFVAPLDSGYSSQLR